MIKRTLLTISLFCIFSGFWVNAEIDNYFLSAVSGNGYIEISWEEVDGAESYRLYRTDYNGRKEIAELSSTVFKDTDVNVGETFNYFVYIYDANGYKFAETNTVSTSMNPFVPLNVKYSYSNNKVLIGWTSCVGADYYEILRESSDGTQTVIKTADCRYTDLNISAGVEYTYRVRSVYRSKGIDFTSGYSKPLVLSESSLKPPKVKIISAAAVDYNSVLIEWERAEDVAGYAIYRRFSGGDWQSVGMTDKLCYTYNSAKPSIKTYYKIRAYRIIGGKRIFGEYSSVRTVTTKLEKPKIDGTPEVSSNSVRISWSKIAGATGYRVYIKQSGGKWKRVIITRGLKAKYSKLKTGKVYYIKVRACRKIGSEYYYSDYSSQRILRPQLDKAKVHFKKSSSKSAEISLQKVSGASGYRVYLSTQSNKKYKLVETAKSGGNAKVKISGLKPDSKYYVKVRAYKTVDGKKVFGKYSNILYFKTKK